MEISVSILIITSRMDEIVFGFVSFGGARLWLYCSLVMLVLVTDVR